MKPKIEIQCPNCAGIGKISKLGFLFKRVQVECPKCLGKKTIFLFESGLMKNHIGRIAGSLPKYLTLAYFNKQKGGLK